MRTTVEHLGFRYEVELKKITADQFTTLLKNKSKALVCFTTNDGDFYKLNEEIVAEIISMTAIGLTDRGLLTGRNKAESILEKPEDFFKGCQVGLFKIVGGEIYELNYRATFNPDENDIATFSVSPRLDIDGYFIIKGNLKIPLYFDKRIKVFAQGQLTIKMRK